MNTSRTVPTDATPPALRRLAIALLVLAPCLAIASPLSLYQQRQAYRQALDHLTAGRTEAFQQARRALDDYALAPYLDYYRVKTRLASISDEEMHAFLERHAELPVTPLLHRSWLVHLGARGQWQRMLANYQPSADPELRCYHLRALLATGRRNEALAEVGELWTVPVSQPKACDPLFDAWIAAGNPDEERAWERLQLALAAGERRLGRYLLRFFDGELEPWAQALYQVHLEPERLVRPGVHANDSAEARIVIAHGLKRLAARDPAAAALAWQRYQDTHAFPAELAQSLTETILLAQAREGRFPVHRPIGLSGDFFEGMAMAAVQAERWQDVLFYIEQLPEARRRELGWQYWLARALERTGLGSDRAQRIYEAICSERHYYGFLAAARLGREINLNPARAAFEAEQIEALQRMPAVSRALELYAVGDLTNARREWIALLPRLTPEQQLHAARLAQEAGWITQSIVTANLADLRDHLELRFPLAYAELFQQASKATAVPRPFLLAIARQESAFDPNARSSANARGLMQLMHPTATRVAERLGIGAPSVTDLYDPLTSVKLGGHHLAVLLDRYDRRRALAAAAYNAGEHRVDRWLRERADRAMDVWIESIPFRETRDYVKNVLAFTQVYGRLLGEDLPMLDPQELALD
ncbi:MAG TPA: transglycosylase SLT domain-containing protein [Pseudomonadales bacterium]